MDQIREQYRTNRFEMSSELDGFDLSELISHRDVFAEVPIGLMEWLLYKFPRSMEEFSGALVNMQFAHGNGAEWMWLLRHYPEHAERKHVKQARSRGKWNDVRELTDILGTSPRPIELPRTNRDDPLWFLKWVAIVNISAITSRELTILVEDREFVEQLPCDKLDASRLLVSRTWDRDFADWVFKVFPDSVDAFRLFSRFDDDMTRWVLGLNMTFEVEAFAHILLSAYRSEIDTIVNRDRIKDSTSAVAFLLKNGWKEKGIEMAGRLPFSEFIFYLLCRETDAALGYLGDRVLALTDNWLQCVSVYGLPIETGSVQCCEAEGGFILASLCKIVCNNGLIKRRGIRNGLYIYTSKMHPVSDEAVEEACRSRAKSAKS